MPPAVARTFNAIRSTASIVRWNSSLVDIPAQKFDPPHTRHEEAQTAVRKSIFRDAVKATAPRQNWTREEISAIFYQPLLELTYQAVSTTMFSLFPIKFPYNYT